MSDPAAGAREPAFIVAIPARYGASRLPGKPLRELAGKPLLAHVHARALESGAAAVVIATDDARIRDVAQDFGAQVCMTASHHPSGTDRLAEVARHFQWPEETIVVNLQGDEPLVDPLLLRALAADLAAQPSAAIATLCTPIRTAEELFDPHVVKVVCDRAGFALYFSRAPIPWDRDAFAADRTALPASSQHYRHVGLYAYRAGYLEHYSQLEPTYLERAESLEQLRALAHGARIHVRVTEEPPGHGVDTEEDLQRVEKLLQAGYRR